MTPRDLFLKLLRDDILQVDLADLDFGIYRLLNHRRARIERFLTEQLPAQIEAALAQLPGAATEDEQARLYNELYTFFNRYYEDGDFVPRARRGRDAAYSVAYNGQDVHFHWATKGSHYVKSGERFAGYAYRQPDGQRVALAVRAADTEKDNVKGERRYYMPAAFEDGAAGPRLLFDYRKLDSAEARRHERKGAAPTDEASDGEAATPAAEGRGAQERILNAWRDGLDFKALTLPAGIDRALLAGHARRYVKGQTADFFVHPRLAEFLRGELDYHLKNEFVRVWHLADGDALARERGKYAIVKQLAEAIIDVLAAIEDVQAVLFEKRKFVLAADWLARASALAALPGGAALVAQAAANPAQVAQWAQWLGENPATCGDGPALLERFAHLPIHTAHFDADFKAAVLACFDDLDAATGGVLIHAENYAALRTIEPAYRQAVKCIYIDPPYNTGNDGFLYRDEIKHSAWASMFHDRLLQGLETLSGSGSLYVSINDNERNSLFFLAQDIPAPFQELAVFTWKSRAKPTNTGPAALQPQKGAEYVLLLGSDSSEFFPISTRESRNYPNEESGRRYRTTTILTSNTGRYRRDTMRTALRCGYIPSADQRWKFGEEEIIDLEMVGRIGFREDGVPYLKIFEDEDTDHRIAFWTFVDPEISDTAEGGKGELNSLLSRGHGFDTVKPTSLVSLFLAATAAKQDIVLDYFGGTGTTAHAVLNLNREDGGERKFVLVEQGEYFDTVLLPRVAKVMACPDWKDGKPRAAVRMQPAAHEDPAAHWSARTPALVKVLRLERYEDALDALELPAEEQARAAGQLTLDHGAALIRYLADSAAAGSTVRLATAKLSAPFDYRLPYTREGVRGEATVDLPETAHLLLGLHPLRLRRLVAADGGPALLVEARAHKPGGGPTDARVLLFWRNVDERLAGAALAQARETERDWLIEAVREQFGRTLADYTTIYYNRDLLLAPDADGQSLDTLLVKAMMERA